MVAVVCAVVFVIVVLVFVTVDIVVAVVVGGSRNLKALSDFVTLQE